MNLKVTIQDFLDSLSKTAEKVKEEKEENEKKKALEAELDEIEKAYQNSPYMTFNNKKVGKVTELKYEPMSDEEIEETAKTEAENEKKEKEKKLKSVAEEKISALGESKNYIKENLDGATAKISEETEKAKTSAENQALKRGIARSSIVAEELAGLDDASLKALGEVYKKANADLAKADEKIATLKAELSSALDELDGETAVKINEKIKSLKSERDKKAEEVTKYNNALREQTAKEMNSVAKYTGEKNSEEYIKANGDKLKKLYSYYYSLGEDAEKELGEDEEFIKKYVGSDGYSYLKNLLKKEN